MTFGAWYRAIQNMVPEVALETQTARDVARKAGLRRGGGTITTSVISDFVGSAEQPLARQHLVDLTGLSGVFFYSSASSTIYLFRSDNLSSSALDPLDYEPLLDATSAVVSSAAETWSELLPAHLTKQRLTISTSGSRVEMQESLLDGPFAVLLQAV